MTKNEITIITDYFNDKFKLLVESLEGIVIDRLKPIQEDILEIKQNIMTIKKAIKDTNSDVSLLERRVTKLENA